MEGMGAHVGEFAPGFHERLVVLTEGLDDPEHRAQALASLTGVGELTRRHHAVELPQFDDHPQSMAGAPAAGCTVVLKPTSMTPLSALAPASLAEKAGVPKGVFNVITGDPRPIGEGLCEHAGVRFVGFGGSSEVGKILYRRPEEARSRAGR